MISKPWLRSTRIFMRILQVNKFFYRRGGAETHFFNLSKLLVEHGHEVIHFSMEHPLNEPSPYSQYFVSEFDFRKLGLFGAWRAAKRVIYSREAARKLEKLIKDTKPKVAHLHNIYEHLSPSILEVLKKHKIPVVMTLHDYKLICPNYQLYTQGAICERCKRHKYYNAILHRCIFNKVIPSIGSAVELSLHKFWQIYEKNVDVFVSPSWFLKNKLSDWGEDINVEVLPNFVQAKETKTTLGDYLLYFGRLSKEKGLLTLLQAMKQLPEVKLKIVGDGLQKAELSRLMYRYKNVELMGYKSARELAPILANCRAVVVPSEWYENYPMSLVEAQTLGKPAIATEIGGLPELVKNNFSGLLYQPGDVNDLAHRIKLLWSDDALVKRLGANAKKQAKETNNPEAYYQNILSIYQKLLAD